MIRYNNTTDILFIKARETTLYMKLGDVHSIVDKYTSKASFTRDDCAKFAVELGYEDFTKDTINTLFSELNVSRASGIRVDVHEIEVGSTPLSIEEEFDQIRNELCTLKSIENVLKRHTHAYKSPNTPKTTTAPNRKVGLVILNDWHFGLNDSFWVLWDSISGKLVQECDGYDEIYICILGDMFESLLGNIHNYQDRLTESGTKSIITISDEIAKFANACSDFGSKPVTIVAVSGNHDRATKNTFEDPSRVLFSVFIDRIKLRLSDNKAVKFRYDNDLTYKWFFFGIDNNKIRIGLQHGDNNISAKDMIIMDSTVGAQYRVLIKGHFHRRLYEEYTNFAEITCPAMIEPTGLHFTKDNCRKSRPGQTFISLDMESLEVNVRFINP